MVIFYQGVDLALLDDEGRKRSAAVNNTYPGWSGTPGLKFNEKRCEDAIVIQLEECHCRFGISTWNLQAAKRTRGWLRWWIFSSHICMGAGPASGHF